MTTLEQFSAGDELVAFFANQCGDDGTLGRTRLMKLMYLADYESRRYLGKPISGINYVWHHYGPYDRTLQARINKLKRSKVITETPVLYPNGREGYLYCRGAMRAPISFTPAQVEIISYVARKYSQVELRELLDDVVYKTEPMQKALKEGRKAKGKPLDMGSVNGAKSADFTVPFEELLTRSASVRAGRFVPHAEAMHRVDQELAEVA